MIDLQANPLLKEALKPEHIKNRLLGHWGSSPGLAFMYIHLNRLIKKFDLDMIFMAGPWHWAPRVLGRGELEGTDPEASPGKDENERGPCQVVPQVSLPGWNRAHGQPKHPAA